MAFRCQKCSKPLYNRRRTTCECCGAPVPESLRLSGEQRARLEEIREREKKGHREFMERNSSAGGGDAGSGGFDAGSF